MTTPFFIYVLMLTKDRGKSRYPRQPYTEKGEMKEQNALWAD